MACASYADPIAQIGPKMVNGGRRTEWRQAQRSAKCPGRQLQFNKQKLTTEKILAYKAGEVVDILGDVNTSN